MENRKDYIDTLRMIALISVVIIHVTEEWWSCDIATSQWGVLTVFQGLTKVCVPLFMMVSGALFLQKDRQISLKKLYLHNIMRLIIFFLFWAMVYKVIHYIANPYCEIQEFLPTMLKEILCGDVQLHLWYIYAIIPIYIIVPILRIIAGNASRKQLEYFIFIWFVYQCIHFAINHLAFLSLYQNVDFMNISYVGYFVIGHYLDVYGKSLKEKMWGVVGIASIITSMILVVTMSLKTGVVRDDLFSYLTPGTILWSVSVFLFVRNRWRPSGADKWISLLSKYSLGIYGCHFIFILILKHYNILAGNYPLLISVPIITGIILLAGTFTAAVGKKIPLLSKVF